MLKIIQNNPYRFLGVCSNAPLKERVSNGNRLKAYLNVGRNVKFPLDLLDLIPEVKRDLDGLNFANSCINLPKEQLKYALFWFVNASSIDNMALEYLQKGNYSKTAELLSKKENFSSLINRGVLSFINENNGDAIECISKVIHTTSYRKDFVETICGSTFQIQEDELAQLFLESLLNEFSAFNLKRLFEQFGSSSKDCDFLKEMSVGQLRENINNAIAEAKTVAHNDAKGQYEAGKKLMNVTKSDLQSVRSILGSGDMQYQMIANNLAKTILQCGINYYNNTLEDDDVSIDKAMILQSYAQSIAIGNLKERCNDNVNILKKKKENLPPASVKSETNSIHSALDEFTKLPDKISHSKELLNKTIPYLKSMRSKLGATHVFYLKISTLVVSNALFNVIEEVNTAQKILGSPEAKSNPYSLLAALNICENAMDQGWNVITIMDSFDMEPSFRNGRYNINKNSLRNMRTQIKEITSKIPGTSSYTHSGYSGGTSSSSSDNGFSWGCIIVVIIFIIIYLINR